MEKKKEREEALLVIGSSLYTAAAMRDLQGSSDQTSHTNKDPEKSTDAAKRTDQKGQALLEKTVCAFEDETTIVDGHEYSDREGSETNDKE